MSVVYRFLQEYLFKNYFYVANLRIIVGIFIITIVEIQVPTINSTALIKTNYYLFIVFSFLNDFQVAILVQFFYSIKLHIISCIKEKNSSINN